MSDQTALQGQILKAQERFEAAVAGIDPHALETEPVCGEWPVRVIAWHLGDWIDEMLVAAQASLEGRRVEGHPITDFDAFNQAHVAKGENASWSDSAARLQQAIERATAFASGLSDAQLELPSVFPWGGEGALARLMAGIPWHHGVHTEDVERWRNAG
jgi:DinB superfamily